MMRLPAVLLSLMLMASCGQLQDVALYDVVQPEADVWAAFEYAEVFTDSGRTPAFGLKDIPCRSFRAVKEGSHSGEDHLHLQWDQSEGCRYIGMGFLWKDYKGKDLTGIYEEGAIELMVRVDSGFLTKVPMFFSLADYGGKRCVTKMSLLDMEGGGIGTEWTRVRIPLQAFRPERNGVNLANIKELRIEFQQKGDVHVDDIRIVPHQHHYGREASTSTHRVTRLPFTLGEGQESWWGITPDESDHFRFVDSPTGWEGSEAVVADVRLQGKKPWDSFGFGAHQWLLVDVEEHHSTSAVQFRLKADSPPKLRMTLFAYRGAKRRIQTTLDEDNFQNVAPGEWAVRVPIKSIRGHEDLDWTALKEVRFQVLEDARFTAGDFELAEFRGNPDKPFKWKGG